MILIDKNEMLRLTRDQKGVLIDVREPLEFEEASYPGSINIPLSKFDIEQFIPYKNVPLTLICQTQNRSIKAGEQLQKNGFTSIFILKNGMTGLLNDGTEVNTAKNGWTIDRQFRMTLGVLLLIFLLGSYFISHYFIIIPVILCCGLIFTSIIDRCFMRMAIAKLPWNKGKKM